MDWSRGQAASFAIERARAAAQKEAQKSAGSSNKDKTSSRGSTPSQNIPQNEQGDETRDSSSSHGKGSSSSDRRNSNASGSKKSIWNKLRKKKGTKSRAASSNDLVAAVEDDIQAVGQFESVAQTPDRVQRSFSTPEILRPSRPLMMEASLSPVHEDSQYVLAETPLPPLPPTPLLGFPDNPMNAGIARAWQERDRGLRNTSLSNRKASFRSSFSPEVDNRPYQERVSSGAVQAQWARSEYPDQSASESPLVQVFTDPRPSPRTPLPEPEFPLRSFPSGVVRSHSAGFSPFFSSSFQTTDSNISLQTIDEGSPGSFDRRIQTPLTAIRHQTSHETALGDSSSNCVRDNISAPFLSSKSPKNQSFPLPPRGEPPTTEDLTKQLAGAYGQPPDSGYLESRRSSPDLPNDNPNVFYGKGKYSSQKFTRIPAPKRRTTSFGASELSFPQDQLGEEGEIGLARALEPSPLTRYVASERKHIVKPDFRYRLASEENSLGITLPTTTKDSHNTSLSRQLKSTCEVHEDLFVPHIPDTESDQDTYASIQRDISTSLRYRRRQLRLTSLADSSPRSAQDEHPPLTTHSSGCSLSPPQTVIAIDPEEDLERLAGGSVRRFQLSDQESPSHLEQVFDSEPQHHLEPHALTTSPSQTFDQIFAAMNRNNEFPYDPMPENTNAAPARLKPKSNPTPESTTVMPVQSNSRSNHMPENTSATRTDLKPKSSGAVNSNSTSMYEPSDDEMKRVLAEGPCDEDVAPTPPATPTTPTEGEFSGSERSRPALRKKRSFTEIIKDTFSGLNSRMSPTADQSDPKITGRALGKSRTRSSSASKHDQPATIQTRDRTGSNATVNVGQNTTSFERAQLDEDFASFKLTVPPGHEERKLKEKASLGTALKSMNPFGKKENIFPDAATKAAQAPGQVLLAQNAGPLPKPKVKVKVEPKAEVKAEAGGKGAGKAAKKAPGPRNCGLPDGVLCAVCQCPVSKEKKAKRWGHCEACKYAYYCGKECRSVHKDICLELRQTIKEIKFGAAALVIDKNKALAPNFFRIVWKHYNFLEASLDEALKFQPGGDLDILFWLAQELSWDMNDFATLNSNEQCADMFEAIIRRALSCPRVPADPKDPSTKHPFQDRHVHSINLWCNDCRGDCATCGQFCCVHAAVSHHFRTIPGWRRNVEWEACSLVRNHMLNWLDVRRDPSSLCSCEDCVAEGLVRSMKDEHCSNCWRQCTSTDHEGKTSTVILCQRHHELRMNPPPVDPKIAEEEAYWAAEKIRGEKAMAFANVHPAYRPGGYFNADGEVQERWHPLAPPGSIPGTLSLAADRNRGSMLAEDGSDASDDGGNTTPRQCRDD